MDESLESRIDRANTTMGGLRTDFARQETRRNWIVAAAAIVALIAVVVAIFAATALTEYKHDTQKARVASCNNYNGQQDDLVKADAAHDLTLAALLVPEPRTADQEAAVAAGLRLLAATSAHAHAHRDCSTRGIAAYLGQTSR